ncbi:hypothetical protein BN159_5773 [Streptomyces davaonensis JCM 4913]|uniref:NB-ARC domain-containing protein n=1 Tax=Streptomyces davaonensis (strain DSM 101723 / JCM 4913 / KCC S-0913 / 768) TaxID=1214101 RepID=K4RAC2_STRDJ|nr:FxSxx-COOH system tetratricopeptide repeat protein [Streptomyces davaonensis]CCK30152.1 hypothetical protein BN159_5773 [Streptomyces davaonensis JCM 4913]
MTPGRDRPGPRELADALWLASEHGWLVGPMDGIGAGTDAPTPPGSASPAPSAGSSTARTGAETDVPPPAPDKPTTPTSTPRPRSSHPAEPTAALSPAATAPDPESRPTDRALGRALRAFRTTVASAHAAELDEEATAELIAPAPFLPPVLRPAAERRWRAVLVVDSAPRMALWHDTVARFARVVRAYGGFRDVMELSLDTTDPGQATVRLPGPARTARPAAARSLVDPTGRSVVFVLTDGAAPAWRSSAAQRLLARWGRRQPVTVLHMLPQRLWHRTGLHPSRIALRSSGPWTAGRPPAWEPAEAVSAVLRARAGLGAATPVPVLEARPEWLEPWARFVGGDEPREVELAAVLTTAEGRPEAPYLRPVRTLEPIDRVAKFRGSASPEAFELATHLAAIPLDLATMTEIQHRTLPRSSTQHLAEILLSDLLSLQPSHPVDRLAFDVDPDVRGELLAHGSRTTTERAIAQAAEMLAPTSTAAQSLLSYLRDGTTTVEPAEGEDQEFRNIERAVLHALSGPHARRARELDELETTVPVPVLPAPLDAPEEHTAAASAVSGRTDPGENDMSVTAPPGPEQRPVERDPNRVGPAVWGNVPPRNAAFTGREQLLEELRESLSSGTAAVLPQALHGMGGVGKSQLALEYVYRYASQYDLVWWIPAEQRSLIRQAFMELADRLGLSNAPALAVPAVLNALRTGNPYGDWLLVFDNADGPEAVQDFIPSRFEGGPAGAVIVTSRNPHWNVLARPVEVGLFGRQESVALLRRRTSDITDDEAELLAEALGDLPLAVEQASVWRAETGMPPKEYVRLLEETGAELMASSPPTQYGTSIASAWGLSLDRLQEQNPGALQLLQLCSHLAPEPIPRAFFTDRLGESVAPELDRIVGDPLRFARAVREINRFSLARINYSANTIQLHRLVQAALRSRMTDEENQRFRHGAHLLLARSLAGEPRNPRHWPTYATLFPHVLASQAPECADPWVRHLVQSLIEWLIRSGNHNVAVDLAQQVHSVWLSKFDEHDTQTRTLGRFLRLALWRTGSYAEAADLGERLVAQWEVDDPEQELEEHLTVKAQTCDDLRVRGDFGGALELGKDIHARAERAFGPDDPFTLECVSNLAVCLRANGNLRPALNVDEDTWRLRVEILGAGDSLTLSSQAAVAWGLQELGRYREALQTYEEVVAQAQELYGESHPTTLRFVVQQAVALRRVGRFGEALQRTRLALDALTKSYGEQAPDTLHATLTHSIDLRHNGHFAEAEALARRARDRYTQTLGARHPQALSAEAGLAVTLRLSGRTDEARRLEESVHQQFRDTLGDSHPYTLYSAMNLANLLFEQDDPSGAQALDEWAIGPMQEVLGETHPMTLVLRANLAMDLRTLGGRRDEASRLHTQALRQLREVLGTTHPAYLNAQARRRTIADIDPMPL